MANFVIEEKLTSHDHILFEISEVDTPQSGRNLNI